MATTASPLLSLEGVGISFGGIRAVEDLSLSVAPGLIFTIIGPNGAGKTTVFNLISGFYRPDRGTLAFEGRDLARLAPHQIAGLGIGRTFQNLELFSALTVLENLLIARHLSHRASFLDCLVGSPKGRSEERAAIRRCDEILGYLGLGDTRDKDVSSFPFPTLKRIELARALALEPRLLLLDEPAGGLNARESEALGSLIAKIRGDFGLTILLVEHDMSMVMGISDRISVIDQGRKIAEGGPAEIQADPRVIEAYLGKGAAAYAQA